MGYEERQRLEPCGCHVDAPTGLVTCFCKAHDPDGRKQRMAKFARDRNANSRIETPSEPNFEIVR